MNETTWKIIAASGWFLVIFDYIAMWYSERSNKDLLAAYKNALEVHQNGIKVRDASIKILNDENNELVSKYNKLAIEYKLAAETLNTLLDELEGKNVGLSSSTTATDKKKRILN